MRMMRRPSGVRMIAGALTMLATIISVLDGLGIVVFAVTGALVASRKQMDIVGFALLAVVTGVGGGTLRDLLLGTAPVFWVREPTSVLICAAVAGITFFTAHIPQSRYNLVLWLDAVGLAVFTVIGAETALGAGASPPVACVMGVITATFGGIIRDILGGESPIILRREIYVTAALLGALVLVALQSVGAERDAAVIAGFAAAFALRGAALTWHWSLPRYKPRVARSYDH
jgi:uncharacterized membrane protein YeiH